MVPSPGDTTAPSSSLGAGVTARILQLHWVYSPNDGDRIARVTIDSDELVLGREPEGAKTLVVEDKKVSRVHAAIVRDRASGEIHICDRGSRHGTIVNGKRVDRARLQHGSVIRIGESIFVFADTLLRMEDAKALAPETATLRGSSLAMQRVRGEIALVAPRPLAVLVLGETGVGKERVAQEIHAQSRRTGPLVAVNCAAIPEALAEAELFGHTAGAFTGATQRSDGVLVAADKGTLFLDEIAELPLPLQPKLLRALATGEVRALGKADVRTVNVRIVAATHGDVEGAVGRGGFRGDLLARLAGWTLRVPPLRERREDILGLARFFLQKGGASLSLSAGGAEALLLHDWRFNVRELEQVLAAAVIRASEGVIRAEHFPEPIARPVLARAATVPSDPPAIPLQALVPHDAIPDREGLLRVAGELHGNIAQIAAYFGKDRKQIYRWAEKLGVDLDSARANPGGERGERERS